MHYLFIGFISILLKFNTYILSLSYEFFIFSVTGVSIFLVFPFANISGVSILSNLNFYLHSFKFRYMRVILILFNHFQKDEIWIITMPTS